VTTDVSREVERGDTAKTAAGRIIGLDVARAFAIWGMVIVNYKNAMQADLEPAWLYWMVARCSTRASVTFVVLAGIGVSLLSARARNSGEPLLIRAARLRLARRGLFLLVLGCAFFVLWPGDILHFYAFYLSFSALFITAPGWTLWLGIAAAWAGNIAFVFLSADPGKGHYGHFYLDFWTVQGFFRNVFFNGAHPVLPWFAFILVGMLIGRLDLARRRTQVIILTVALTCALVGEFGSRLLMAHNIGGDWAWLLRLRSRPASPFFMMAAVGTAVSVIMVGLIVADWFRRTLAVRALASTGQLALTNYLGHVIPVLGGLVLIRSFEQMAEGTGAGIFDNFSILAAYHLIRTPSLPVVMGMGVGYYAVAIVFSYFWRKRFARGPLEWLMRRLAG
jgi:uncharacterized membrane protein YeiB